jgi:hypothetical protein
MVGIYEYKEISFYLLNFWRLVWLSICQLLFYWHYQRHINWDSFIIELVCLSLIAFYFSAKRYLTLIANLHLAILLVFSFLSILTRLIPTLGFILFSLSAIISCLGSLSSHLSDEIMTFFQVCWGQLPDWDSQSYYWSLIWVYTARFYVREWFCLVR